MRISNFLVVAACRAAVLGRRFTTAASIGVVALMLAAPEAMAQPGTQITKVALSVDGFGVSVAVDCTGVVYFTRGTGGTDNDATLYKMNKTGGVVGSVAIKNAAGAPVQIDEMAWDETRKVLWGVEHNTSPEEVWQINPTTGVATHEFTATNTTSVGIFRDGIAFDGADDTLWISADVSTTIEHYSTAGTFLAAITPKNSGGTNLDNISGVVVGVGDLLYLGQDGGATIVKVKKSDGSFISSFASPGGVRDEGLECDPVNFTPKLGLWSRDYPNVAGGGIGMSVIELDPGTCSCGGGGLPGRMTGGGSVFTKAGERVTHGFELHCKTSDLPNNLEVNWDNNRFHLESLDTAICTDDPNIVPNPPNAGFDTYLGTGTGRLNGVPGAKAAWTFTDAGEPGTKDTAKIVIKDSGGVTVLDVSGNLTKGNQQAHNN